MSPDRRQFLVMGAAAFLAGPRAPDGYGPALRATRTAIRDGRLGAVHFCRVFSDGSHDRAHLLEAAQYALGESGPRSITSQSIEGRLRFATLRYPGCIVSYESGASATAITFHGTRATFRVDFSGRIAVSVASL